MYAFVTRQFLAVQETLKPLVTDSISYWPAGTLSASAKISKGEYLEGLPYMVLDFPRALKGSSKMLFRTLFWWGKGWSCIGYMEGENARKGWETWLELGLPENFRVSVSPHWQHDVQKFPLAGTDKPLKSAEAPLHFWVGTWMPPKQIAELPSLARTTYASWISLLS